MPGGVEVCEEVSQLLVGFEDIRARQLVDRRDRADALAASKLSHGHMLSATPPGKPVSIIRRHGLDPSPGLQCPRASHRQCNTDSATQTVQHRTRIAGSAVLRPLSTVLRSAWASKPAKNPGVPLKPWRLPHSGFA